MAGATRSTGATGPAAQAIAVMEPQASARLDGTRVPVQVDDAGLRLRTADTDLDEVVREEIARMRPASRHEVRVHVDPVRVRGDASRLQQVVRNLLSTAERHADTWIEVYVTDPTSDPDHLRTDLLMPIND